MKDKYDRAVEYLTQYPENISGAWGAGITLFQYCGDGQYFGCLTEVKSLCFPAETEKLTKAIRLDNRIPKKGCDIKPEHLHVFAEWQRRLDRELTSRRKRKSRRTVA